MNLLEWHGPAIRTNNKYGALRTTGYQWDEMAMTMMRRQLGVCIVAGVLMVLFVAARNWAGVAVSAWFVFGLGLNIAYTRLWRRMIVFERDGDILAPHGIPRRFLWRELPIKHQDITSIEVLPDGAQACVAIFTEHGETFIVGRLESIADARLVAVQLTKALHEMRQDKAAAVMRNLQSRETARRIGAIH